MISWNQSYKLIIVHGLKKNSLTFNLLVIIAFNAKNFKCFGCETA